MARQKEGKEDVTQISDPQHPSWQRHGPKVGAEVTTHFNYATLNSKLLTLEMQESAKKNHWAPSLFPLCSSGQDEELPLRLGRGHCDIPASLPAPSNALSPCVLLSAHTCSSPTHPAEVPGGVLQFCPNSGLVGIWKPVQQKPHPHTGSQRG